MGVFGEKVLIHKDQINNLLNTHNKLPHIIDALHKAGAVVILVGGAVRDFLLGVTSKDLDIEIYGLALAELENVLKKFGPVSLVGKSFGVLRLHGLDVDWSLPRTDSSGRHPEVSIDHMLSYKEAFKRRDLTINALGIDCKSYQLIDEYGGHDDLKAGILRVVDPKLFVEDPLRFYRVMQFAGRLGFAPDDALSKLCAGMDLTDVSRERIEQELEKLLLRSQTPSLGFRWIRKIGRINELFPELGALIDVPQDPEWHPEGDVFEHTMQVIDAAARATSVWQRKLVVMYGALCHDLGKVTATKMIDGRWRCHGHEVEGVAPARTFLKRYTRQRAIIGAVERIVRRHMAPPRLGDSSDAAILRLALKCGSATNLSELACVAYADRLGRNGAGMEPLQGSVPELDDFIKRAKKLKVLYGLPKPILQGRDVKDFVEPGPVMGKLLKYAYDLQVEHGVTDRDALLQRALQSQGLVKKE
jgi:tRNA nucleotidyltransferase (CCA-adding enzyme)